MKKKMLASVLCIVMGVTLLAGCGSSNTDKKEDNTQNAKAEETTVTLFAAKSLNRVMDELIAEYNKTNPNVKIVGSYDSSGTLLTQIEEGAACDIFFSAAQKQMDQLADDDGLVVDGTRYNVVNNQVCVVTYKGSLFRLENIPDRRWSMQECLRAQMMFLPLQLMKFPRHLAVWKSMSAQTLEP